MTKEEVKQLINQIDDYQETILAIVTFGHAIRWEKSLSNFKPETYFCIGRKMNTSKSNRVLPNDIVTPDFIVQINKKYGIVGEVKIVNY